MNNNTFVHKYIRTLINKNDVTVDMTSGNGNDTLYLAELSGFVYAFDISKQAIERTTEKIQGYNNVRLINDNHINIDRYGISDIRLFIFNLGYLPNSDNSTITSAQDTLAAFKKAYALLKDDGYIIITFYLGHHGGKSEYYLLDEYIRKNNIKVMEKYSQQKIDSPITYVIRKDHSSTSI